MARQIGDHGGNFATFGQPLLLVGPIQAMHHLDLQIGRGLLKGQVLIDVSLLTGRRDGFPGTQPHAALLDLLDQRVERLLPFRQRGSVVVARDGD